MTVPDTIKSYDEYSFGFSWVLDEPLERTSHALVSNGRVWLVDPVDVPGAIERAKDLGRAGRGAAAARPPQARLCRRGGATGLHVKVPDTIPGSPFEALPALRIPGWRETALWWPEQRALVVAEVVGTALP